MPSLAITTKSQFQSGLWLFVKIDGLDKKERLETSIFMVTDNKNIIFEVLLFVKLTDKTRCFMQIADNILIFILTTGSMLLSHCHCQGLPVSAKTKFKLN